MEILAGLIGAAIAIGLVFLWDIKKATEKMAENSRRGHDSSNFEP